MIRNGVTNLLTDPFRFLELCWPDMRIYDKQAEIIESVRDNDETIVPAGNQLGKDFISGFIALWFFCSRSPCRVITTSVDQPQLKGVLWGEIRRFIQTSKYPLPIIVNDLMIRQLKPDGTMCPLSYLIGRVTKKGEGLLGHHVARGSDMIPRTLAIFDEASGLDNECYEVTDTWAHRKLTIGNPYPCTNFFYNGVKEGDLKNSRTTKSFFRKIIKIRAEDSPNVKLAIAQQKKGIEPKNDLLIPGVKDYFTYEKHRELWDEMRQSIGLDAEFYEGAEVMLYPPLWLDRAERLHDQMDPKLKRKARGMGVDAAEGGDSTVWTVVDEYGVLFQLSLKTKDTSDIPGRTLALMREWELKPQDIAFDRGGGGKQHADLLRKKGYNVRTVGFGEAVTDPNLYRRMKTSKEKVQDKEHSYEYKNRRAEMYGLLRRYLNPDFNEDGFAIPRKLEELRRQLSPLPLLYDGEGRMYLPPKDKRKKESQEETLREMLGRSPDEADSLVLAIYAMTVKTVRSLAGAI